MEILIGQDKTRAGQVADILTSAILRIQAKQSVDEFLHRGGAKQPVDSGKVIDIDQFIETHVGKGAR